MKTLINKKTCFFVMFFLYCLHKVERILSLSFVSSNQKNFQPRQYKLDMGDKLCNKRKHSY